MAAEVQVEPEQEATPNPKPSKPSGKKSAASPIKAGVTSLERYLCWGALGVAGLLVVMFLLDLFASWPFAGASGALDVFMILASGIVIYICIDTLRELR